MPNLNPETYYPKRMQANIWQPQFRARIMRGLAGMNELYIGHPHLRGIERVPVDIQPIIWAPTHRSMKDVVLMANLAEATRTQSPAPIFKKELLYPVARWAFHKMGGVAVDRDEPDLRSLDIMRNRLNSGVDVLIYPEGTRKKENTRIVESIKPGAALLALGTGCKIVPVGTAGVAEEDPETRHVVMVAGEPINPRNYGATIDAESLSTNSLRSIVKQVRPLSRDLTSAMQASMDEAYAAYDELVA
jgi:1-acyl-sn-glycerol-3-phosphate acyltransferase